ncbi:MAG: ABC transporter substrate-binding protein [Phenylobacterium sp.]
MAAGFHRTVSRRVAAGGLAAAVGLGAAPVGPHRIVSLNPCLDAQLVHIADRRQIAGLSRLSRNSATSTLADLAVTLPSVGDTAEAVILKRPDLVLASAHTSAATRRALERLGVPVAVFETPASLAASLDQVRRIAALARRPERGEALAARIRAALDTAAPRPGGRRPEVLIRMSGGISPGAGTLTDDLLSRLGLSNAAGRLGVRGWGLVRLEALLAAPPEVLVLADDGGRSGRADQTVRHPALMALDARVLTRDFPERLLFCGGPVLIEAAAELARIRDSALEIRP